MTLRGLDWRAIRGSFHNETKTHPYLPFNERPADASTTHAHCCELWRVELLVIYS